MRTSQNWRDFDNLKLLSKPHFTLYSNHATFVVSPRLIHGIGFARSLNVLTETTNPIWRLVALQHPVDTKYVTMHASTIMCTVLVIYGYPLSRRKPGLCLPIFHLFHQLLATKDLLPNMVDAPDGVYPYDPSHAAAIVLSIAIGASLAIHIYQGL